MPKLTKSVVDKLVTTGPKDLVVWDADLKGFGVRVKANGTKSYIVQYRNVDGVSRRLTIGRHGLLAPEQARRLALKQLGSVAAGEDPVEERRSARAGMTVAKVCDWYLEEAEGGRLLGRSRRQIKASSLRSDRGRIELHIKPLLGSRPVHALTLADIERMQADIARGKTTRPRKGGRGGAMKGGPGVAGRTVATLRAVLGHAKRWRLIAENPALGVRQIVSEKRTRRLSESEIVAIGSALEVCACDGEPPAALAAIRLMLRTGLRRMEVLGLQFPWVRENAIAFPDTKAGPQTRALGRAALELIARQKTGDDQVWVFPSERTDGHFVYIEKTLRRACSLARIEGVTAHTLRHTFASVAADQGFSELTIAGLLGHASMGVTQRYVHLDKALVVAADAVAAYVEHLLTPLAVRSRLAA